MAPFFHVSNKTKILSCLGIYSGIQKGPAEYPLDFVTKLSSVTTFPQIRDHLKLVKRKIFEH